MFAWASAARRRQAWVSGVVRTVPHLQGRRDAHLLISKGRHIVGGAVAKAGEQHEGRRARRRLHAAAVLLGVPRNIALPHQLCRSSRGRTGDGVGRVQSAEAAGRRKAAGGSAVSGRRRRGTRLQRRRLLRAACIAAASLMLPWRAIAGPPSAAAAQQRSPCGCCSRSSDARALAGLPSSSLHRLCGRWRCVLVGRRRCACWGGGGGALNCSSLLQPGKHPHCMT